MEFKPEDRWLYTSYGYNLLGVAIEAVSGKSFEEYMKEYVFLPMGMDQAVPDDLESIVPNRGRYYIPVAIDISVLIARPFQSIAALLRLA